MKKRLIAALCVVVCMAGLVHVSKESSVPDKNIKHFK